MEERGEGYLDVEWEIASRGGHSVKVRDSRGESCTLSMCRRVVFPALSRPRKRSLACLLSSPNEASTSQNHLPHSVSISMSRFPFLCVYEGRRRYCTMNISGFYPKSGFDVAERFAANGSRRFSLIFESSSQPAKLWLIGAI